MNDELNQLIDFALADGIITKKERTVLFSKAKKLGVDQDEFEMVFAAKVYQANKSNENAGSRSFMNDSKKTTSNKEGEITKCPACGAISRSFQTICVACGNEFRKIKASKSITIFFEKIDDLESSRIDNICNNTSSNSRISIGTIIKWWLFWWILIPLHFFAFLFKILKPVKLSSIDSRKEELIINFPVPNSREEFIEFISLAVSKIKEINFLYRFNVNGKHIIKWNSIWISKIEQVYLKSRLSMKEDKNTLLEIDKILKRANLYDKINRYE